MFTDHQVRLWDFPWLNAKGEFSLPPPNLSASPNPKECKIEDADYDKCHQYIAIVTAAAIHIRSRSEAKYVTQLLPTHDYVFRCARFIKEARSPHGFLVTVENSRSNGKPILSLWKVSDWTRKSSVQLYTRLRVTTLSISENSKLIAFGAADGTVGVYDSKLYVQLSPLPPTLSLLIPSAVDAIF